MTELELTPILLKTTGLNVPAKIERFCILKHDTFKGKLFLSSGVVQAVWGADGVCLSHPSDGYNIDINHPEIQELFRLAEVLRAANSEQKE